MYTISMQTSPAIVKVVAIMNDVILVPTYLQRWLTFCRHTCVCMEFTAAGYRVLECGFIASSWTI